MRRNTRIKRVHGDKFVEEEVDDLIDVIAETWLKAWSQSEGVDGGSYYVHVESPWPENPGASASMRVHARFYGGEPAFEQRPARSSWGPAFTSAKDFSVYPKLDSAKSYRDVSTRTRSISDPTRFKNGRRVVPYMSTKDWKLAAYTAWKMSLEYPSYTQVNNSTFVVADGVTNGGWIGRMVILTSGRVTHYDEAFR